MTTSAVHFSFYILVLILYLFCVIGHLINVLYSRASSSTFQSDNGGIEINKCISLKVNALGVHIFLMPLLAFPVGSGFKNHTFCLQ